MKYLKLSILSLILGLAAGVLIWLVLMAMVVGMKVVWEIVLDYFSWSDNLVYDLAVCVLGGRLLAWVHRVFGPGPEPMFAVFARVQREGGYPYHNLHWLALAFLLPIVFGGAVGPAAGITGFGRWTLDLRQRMHQRRQVARCESARVSFAKAPARGFLQHRCVGWP